MRGEDKSKDVETAFNRRNEHGLLTCASWFRPVLKSSSTHTASTQHNHTVWTTETTAGLEELQVQSVALVNTLKHRSFARTRVTVRSAHRTAASNTTPEQNEHQ